MVLEDDFESGMMTLKTLTAIMEDILVLCNLLKVTYKWNRKNGLPGAVVIKEGVVIWSNHVDWRFPHLALAEIYVTLHGHLYHLNEEQIKTRHKAAERKHREEYARARYEQVMKNYYGDIKE